MNPHIKELAEQATRKYDRLGFEIPFAQPDLELFAELIIRDVVATVKRTQVTSPDFEWAILNNYHLEIQE